MRVHRCSTLRRARRGQAGPKGSDVRVGWERGVHPAPRDALLRQVAGAIESVRRFESLAELERLRQEFIARASHELRTSVMVLEGYVGTLRGHQDLSQQQRRSFRERLEETTGRLRYLLDGC